MFGSDYNGCLGISEEEFETLNQLNDKDLIDDHRNVFKPIPVPFFYNQSIKVLKVSCGDSHVVCLTENNEVYTWGNGEYGRLGILLGANFIIFNTLSTNTFRLKGHGDENDINVPKKLEFRLKYTFKDVFAGLDCTFLVTNKGKVLAFGHNEYNKLGLNYAAVGVKKKDNAHNFKARKINSFCFLLLLTLNLFR